MAMVVTETFTGEAPFSAILIEKVALIIRPRPAPVAPEALEDSNKRIFLRDIKHSADPATLSALENREMDPYHASQLLIKNWQEGTAT